MSKANLFLGRDGVDGEWQWRADTCGLHPKIVCGRSIQYDHGIVLNPEDETADRVVGVQWWPATSPKRSASAMHAPSGQLQEGVRGAIKIRNTIIRLGYFATGRVRGPSLRAT